MVGNGLDFGEKKKDLNISRLVECGEKHGKTVVLLVSISPNPFLANGGIPSSLAINNSMTNSGLVQHSFVNDLLYCSFLILNLQNIFITRATI